MKPEIAIRLAASIVDEVTTNQAMAIVNEYLAQLARCPACDDTGRFMYEREVSVPVDRRTAEGESSVMALAGAEGVCPRCLGNGKLPADSA